MWTCPSTTRRNGHVRRSLRCAGGGLPVSRCEDFPSRQRLPVAGDYVLLCAGEVGPKMDDRLDQPPSAHVSIVLICFRSLTLLHFPVYVLHPSSLPLDPSRPLFPQTNPRSRSRPSPLLPLTQRWATLLLSTPLSLSDPHLFAS